VLVGLQLSELSQLLQLSHLSQLSQLSQLSHLSHLSQLSLYNETLVLLQLPVQHDVLPRQDCLGKDQLLTE